MAFPAMLGGACPAPANVHCAWEIVQCAGLAWEGHSSVTSLGAGGAHRSPQSLRHNHDDHPDDDYQLSITMIIRRRRNFDSLAQEQLSIAILLLI